MISGVRRVSHALLCTLTVIYAQAPATLALNKPVRASVGGWEPRVYQIELKAGQYLEAVVEEKGISIQVHLIDPAGKKVLELIGSGNNAIHFIARDGGLHRLEIAAVEPFDRPFGDCQVTVVRLATPTREDRLRAEALQDYLKASGTGTVDAYVHAAGLFAAAGLPQEEVRALASAAFTAAELQDLKSEIALREQILAKAAVKEPG